MKLTSRFWPLLVFTFVGYANEELTGGLKTVNGCPFLTTAGQKIKLLDIVPLENNSKSTNDGRFELSWYDMNKGGFRFVTWYTEIYDDQGMELITDEGGWAEDKENQAYPKDIENLEFGPGEWFFVAPGSLAANPSINVAGQLYTTDATKTTTFLPLTAGVKTCVGNPLPVETYLKDVVPFENNSKSTNDGRFELSWYDMNKGGFRFVTWYTEIYDDQGMELITDEGGWAEDKENQAYPKDIETIKWEVGAGFFVAPGSLAATPSIHFINPFYKD